MMREEIFGPVLPILTVTSEEDAITFINARERPLTLYVFSSSTKVAASSTSQYPQGQHGVTAHSAHCSRSPIQGGSSAAGADKQWWLLCQ